MPNYSGLLLAINVIEAILSTSFCGKLRHYPQGPDRFLHL